MRPVVTGYAERYELRTAKRDRTCFTWQERDGAREDQCVRVIAAGEVYMLQTIYPGHDSGYADGGGRRWKSGHYDYTARRWVHGSWEHLPPSPISESFCLPCCDRWTNLRDALALIRERQAQEVPA